MDLRKEDSYVSCMKIRGIPIIPPLMTDDLRTEMRYYKHLALAVEERLKKLQSYSGSEHDSRLETITQNAASTPEDSSNCEEESDARDKTSEGVSVVEPPTERTSENGIQQGGEGDSSVVADTTSTDINRYLDDTLTSDTVVSTVDNSPEWKKPEVPKTLDIVPITVDATSIPNGKVDEPLRESQGDGSQESGTETVMATPKLVRQGSYILETPSPLLLAHLRDESTFVFDDYTPSSRQSNVNSSRRKEWNINEAKSEWELHKTRESIMVTDTRVSGGFRSGRVRRNSTSGALQSRTGGTRSTATGGGRYFGGAREIAKSADCIHSMLYRESVTKNTKSSTIAMTNGHSMKEKESSRKVTTSSSWKYTRSVSIPSCGKKFGGSLGNLGSSSPAARATKRSTTPQKQMAVSRSFDKSLNSTNSSSLATKSSSQQALRGSTQKLLSAVTSEKLIDVFKEIQNTHERQMSQLVARQQREQYNMQKEFEKQQILLLAQIEQTFPGISLTGFSDRVVTRPTDVDSPAKSLAASSPKQSNPKNAKCPLDGIYPTEDMVRSTDGRFVSASPSSPPINGSRHRQCSESINSQRKDYAVSRQLFPLESKTSHLPVPDKRPTYEDKHIKAATTINAYARGYLVRRIMQTDRVLALKTTYGEALRCMLRLHVDAPLALPELNFHQRLQLQCDAASINIVELFAQEPAKKMEIIKQDREVKRARQERPNSARSCYSFATQRTLARKKLKEMGDFEKAIINRSTTARSRCQTWTFNSRDKRSPSLINQGIKRSTSAGAVRKPWR